MNYYEVGTNSTVHAFDTLEEAFNFADENNCKIISEVGGNWEEWEKCTFCGDWFPSSELDKKGICDYCHVAVKSRGEEL